MKEQRKLAAIMFTDIAGYTALMGKDEEKALRILQKNRDVLKPFITSHQGKWLKEMGDGTLSSFPSAVEAVNCALEIQRSLKDETEFKLRIGIHIGDVVISKGDIFGSGVNIASRIEPLAEPGGICISERVYDDISNKPGIETVFIGEKKLKNVSRPVKVYALIGDGLQLPNFDNLLEESAGLRKTGFEDTEAGKIVIPTKNRMVTMGIAAVVVILAIGFFGRSFFMGEDAIPRVVVLPFENIGEVADEFFASNLSQEIAGKLSAVNGLRLTSFSSARGYDLSGKTIQQIGTDLNADYILKGEVQWVSGGGTGNVRITPELIRSSDDTGIWSQNYNNTIKDIIELQSEITNNVLSALNITVSESEQNSLDTKPTENLEAYNLYLRGLQYYDKGTEEVDIQIAIQSFQEAVVIDPDFALAYTWLSRSHSRMYWYFYDRTEDRLVMAKESVDKAFTLTPGLPEAHVALGYRYYWGYLDYDRALEEFETARKSQPNNSSLLAGIGYVQRRQGRMQEAVANIKAAFELDPRSSEFAYNFGLTYQLMRNYTEAEIYFTKSISLRPDLYSAYGRLGFIYLAWDGNTSRTRTVFEETPSIAASTTVSLYVGTRVLVELFDKNYREALNYLSTVPSEVIDTQYRYTPFSLMYAQAYGLLEDRQLEQENYETARQILETKVSELPEEERFHSALGIAYAGLGLKEEAIREGLRGVELLPVEKEAYRGTFRVEDLARIYTMVGEYEEALDRLVYLLSIPGELSVNILRLDPVWDPMRDNPRFQRLLEGK